MAGVCDDFRVAVLGAGLLGIRIAGELALQGCTVHVYDHSPLTVQTVHSTVARQLDELRQAALLTEEHSLRGRIVVETILSGAVSDADIVVEAVPERLEIKNQLFRDVASVCSGEALLCSSTLSLSLAEVFAGVPNPERTVGLRFLYPVYLINTAEVTFHRSTSDDSLKRVQAFLSSVGKSFFHRMPGEMARVLSSKEAAAMQRTAAPVQVFCGPTNTGHPPYTARQHHH